MRRFFIFDEYNTWYDWRLTLTSKSVGCPTPMTKYISLEGVSGTLDLTEALTGEVEFNDINLSASFMCSEGTYEEREALLTNIVLALHGKKIKIVEPDDTEHYFLGRVKVKTVKRHSAYIEFTLEATCDPWRYSQHETERTIQVNGAVDVVIHNYGRRTLCPVLKVVGTVSITTNGVTTTLTDGSFKVASLRLRQGANVFAFDGSGSVTLVYREASI